MGSGCFSHLGWVGELKRALTWVIQMENFQPFPCCEHEFLRRKQHVGLQHKMKNMTQLIFSVGCLHAKTQHTTAMAACSEMTQPAVGILKEEQLLWLMAFPLHTPYKMLPVQVALEHKTITSVFPQHSQGWLPQKILLGHTVSHITTLAGSSFGSCQWRD